MYHPVDTNITKKEEEKFSTYIPQVQNLHIICLDYHYEIAPIIVWALGSIPKSLNGYVYQLGFNNMEKSNTKIAIDLSYWHSENMQKFSEVCVVCFEQQFWSLMSEISSLRFLHSNDMLCLEK